VTILVERFVVAGEEPIPIALLTPEGRPDAPLVLFQHGLGGRKEDAIGVLLELAEQGYRVASMDARWHGARRPDDYEARFEADFLTSFMHVVDRTASDVTAVLDALGAREAGFVGVSMGAYIAYWSIPREPRLQAVAALIGSPGHTAEIPGRPDLEAAIRERSPLEHLDRFPPTALLMINGEMDEVVPPEGVRLLYDALRPLYEETPDRLILLIDPTLGHEVTPAMWRASFEWIARHVPGDDPTE
jgi:pimeloyl-ACP methyl ester carboxylesterase